MEHTRASAVLPQNEVAKSPIPFPRLEAERLAAFRRCDKLDPPQERAFDRITRLAAQIFHVPFATLTVVDQDRICVKSAFGVSGLREVLLQDELYASAIKSDQVYIVENAIDDPRTRLDGLVASTIGIRFYVGVPIISADGRNAGTLCVFDRFPHKAKPQKVEMLTVLSKVVSDELELRLAAPRLAIQTSLCEQAEAKVAIATQLALDETSLREYAQAQALTAIQAASDETSLREQADLENRGLSGRYEQQLRVAQRFQNAAMPRALPEVPGLRFSSFYHPASDATRVGGDWYDAARLPDGRVILSIGDVSGSGLDAAVAMANVRQVLRGVAHIHPDPVTMLDAADRTIYDEELQPIVTAFVAVLDPVTSLLTFASAGHPRPMLRRADGTVTELCAFGLPLGLPIRTDPRVGKTIAIPPDSLLVLYTDGVTEATHDLLAGEELLRTVISNGAILDAPNIAAAIYTAVVTSPSNTSRSNDDVAILTIRTSALPVESILLSRWHFDVTDANAARKVCNEYLDDMTRHKIDATDRTFAEIVLRELIANVVRYAPGLVEIALDWCGPTPVLHVLDRGPGFRYDPNVSVDSLSDRGRGLTIVRLLSEEFLVSERPDGGSHARSVLPCPGTRLGMRGYNAVTNSKTATQVQNSPLMLDLLVAGIEDYAIFILDANGHVATWNAGAERFKGYRSEEIIGRHFSVFYPPEDVAAGKPELQLAIAAAEGCSKDEGWRVRQDGTHFWANVLITALRNSDGTLHGFGKITRDLTERRAADAALRVSEDRFRCSFDEAKIGMLIVDLDGRYARVNEMFCSIVGYSHEQLANLSSESITHPDDLGADAVAVQALLAGDATSRACEKRYLHASGHPVWVAINLTLIRDLEGWPLHFIAQVQDITERRLYERQLEHMADHDPLTGLLNRRSFQRELDSHVARAARYGETGAVFMLDLDHFKYFNDSQGHSAGDQLIVRIAQGLQSRLRDSDVLARLGGDEFAVLLPSADEHATHFIAEALLRVVREEVMPVLDRYNSVTASIGIARFDDGEDLTPEEILVNADLAMYDAKEAGRNRWARYCTEQHDRPRIESRMKWAEKINDAIADDGFELFAQPIVPLVANRSTQYELLLRMRDRQGGLIPPSSFLYVAERLGLVGEIDRWVSIHAIDMLAAQRKLGNDLRFEVNLSGLSIGDEGLIDLVERRLKDTGVPPDRLIFEITETAAIAHIGRAVRFAERLAAIGCRFALDDFGAGFGSFYYLKHLPCDYLKIDGEFVQHCAENETDRILVAAIVQIAHDMGKQTIAEFVSNRETVEVLSRLGVDYVQGFYLGRPAPLSEHLLAPSTQIAGWRL